MAVIFFLLIVLLSVAFLVEWRVVSAERRLLPLAARGSAAASQPGHKFQAAAGGSAKAQALIEGAHHIGSERRCMRVAIQTTIVASALVLVWANLFSPTETPVDGDGFSAVPVPVGIHLRWGPDVAPNATIERTPAGGTPEIIGSTLGRSEFVDRTAAVNRLYTYRIRGLEHSAVAVRSDIQRPFDCTGMPRVPAPLLGVDRTEVFDAPSGRRVTFTIRAPEKKRTVVEVPPCEHRPGCSDYANIKAAIAAIIKAGGGRVQLEAGVYEISPPRGSQRWSQIEIDRASDLILSGAGQRDGLPATQLVFDARPSGGERPELMQALAISSGQRVLVRNIAIDWNRPLAIPGKVVDVAPGEQRLLVDDGAYYIPDPANPPIITIIGRCPAEC